MNMMKIPLNFVGGVEIVNKGKGRRIVGGYCNVAVVDSQKQFIPLQTLKEGLNTLLNDMSYANLMLTHQNIQIGKILKEYGKLKTHVDDKGAYLLAEIRNDLDIANETWQKIINGELRGFSIGCEVLLDHRECESDDKCITILDKIHIFECSICQFPVNQLSGFTIISKSDLSSDDVCDCCNFIDDKMTEENKKEEIKKEEVPKAEEKKEQPTELSVEERIESIERAIFNMEATINKLAEVPDDEEKKPPEEKPPEETKPEEKPSEEQWSISKTDIDSILKSLNTLIDMVKVKEEQKANTELQLEIKARDEQIDALKRHVESLSKPEVKEEPKTVQDNTDIETIKKLEEDCPIVVKGGSVTSRRFV